MYVPVNPYRSFDSRASTDGYLVPGEEIIFDVLTNDVGVQQIPAEAVAVTYNLTVTGTFGGFGYLALYPADINWPGNSSINWTQNGTTLANGGTVAIGYYDAPGQVALYFGLPNRVAFTDFLIDITGYYF